MTTPRVTEIPPRMVAVERDPFADSPARRRVSEREASARRLALVRGLLRDGRNARAARRTDRA